MEEEYDLWMGRLKNKRKTQTWSKCVCVKELYILWKERQVEWSEEKLTR